MTEEMKDIQMMMKASEQGYEAEITQIQPTTNHKFFDSTKFDERDGYAVTFQVKIGKEVNEWDEFFGTPKPMAFIKSKIGRFCHKYDTYPQIGMKVKVMVDEDGFMRCVI